MYILESKAGAIALILLAIVCGGSFSALMQFMERRGRLPQHIYLDFAIANFLVAVLIAVTAGQIGESKAGMPNFFTQLSQIQDNWTSVLFAVAGGLTLSVGNMMNQYAMAFVGLAVSNIIACSMVAVLGTTVNYFLDGRINKAGVLFPGIACFIIAMFLGAFVHYSNVKDKEQKLSMLGGDFSTANTNRAGIHSLDIADEGLRNDESHNAYSEAKAGTAEFIAEVETRRAIKVVGTSKLLGIGIVFLAAILFVIFLPALNIAINDQWHVLKKGVPHLVVYTAFFYFYLVDFLLAVSVNLWLLYRPVAGVPQSTVQAYLNDWNGRHWALLSGLVLGICNGSQFIAGQAAGFATANATMAIPLVSTFWEIILFGEYRRSSRKTYFLLTIMLTMFVIAIGLYLASAGNRKNA
ncbi:hypothetical protein ACP4OV_014961 [Aristida adscensionis]